MSKSVGEQVEQIRLERRSALFRWLYEHHDELAPMLNGIRPPWAATAETFARSKAGKVVTRQAVRKAWPMVKAAKRRSGGAPVRARVENFDPKRDVPFPAEALRPADRGVPFPIEPVRPDDDDDFEIHDVMGRPIK
jgi:hypothetical protein